jgi:hypothetical protein
MCSTRNLQILQVKWMGCWTLHLLPNLQALDEAVHTLPGTNTFLGLQQNSEWFGIKVSWHPSCLEGGGSIDKEYNYTKLSKISPYECCAFPYREKSIQEGNDYHSSL